MKKTKSMKLISLLLSMMMVLGLFSVTGMTASAASAVSYREASWNGSTVNYSNKSVSNYTVVNNSDGAVTWNSGWYVVNANVTIKGRIKVNGTVNLVLCDNCTLDAVWGITVSTGNTLNIYAQAGGKGKLNANTAGNGGVAPNYYPAGIGGEGTAVVSDTSKCGSITIHGGVINATSGKSGAGIGGASQGAGGTITIYGGTVTAVAQIGYNGGQGAGIGGGNKYYEFPSGQSYYGVGGTTKIYGGTVYATGYRGIGAGKEVNDNGTLTVSDELKVFGGNSEKPTTVIEKQDGDYERPAYMVVSKTVPHDHDFTYSADADVITATCGNDNCGLTDNKVTLTLVPPTLTTYGGTGSASATLTGLDEFRDATELTVAATDIMYVGRNNTTYAESTTAPTGAGEYTAKITVDNATASVNYEIFKADPTYIVPTGLKAVCGNTLASVTLPEHWTWADDTLEVGDKGNNIFEATFTPENTDNYNTIENVEVPVSVYDYYSANNPTCEEDGNIAYYEDGDGNLFTDLGESAIRKEQTVIEKLGHRFINFLKWVWDGFNKAVAWLFCDNDPDHVETIDVPSMVDTVDTPDCTHEGYIYHVATIDVAGKIYSTVNVETLDQLGHDWSPVYVWDYDGVDDGVTVPDYYLKVTLICNNDEDHKLPLDVKMERIENEDGSVTFIGHCEYDGVDYTDSITVKVEPATPDVPTPDKPTPATPDVPTPDVPTPDVPTPDVPTPDVPTPDVPTPDVPTPDVPTPDVPTPDVPTPDVPTPDVPTPDVPTPDEPEKELKGILGDVNNDGVVDSADALLILRNSVDMQDFTELQKFLGDVDFDGENITSADALAVLRYSIGMSENDKIGTPVSKTAA